ncbi:extensin-like [Odontomachus brunneus]|uniref:extensin-like n=1 Tax=Odontomachus brunneus TaxID=486640 RepID=UPI0013F28FA0|nr:extensin-like [Odontomachus brunneus]
MYLKNCCALLLLALVACQAAPSTFKNIEKKSISEKTNKIEKDNLKIEDPGLDKDRAKKSTTSFCVEIRDGKEVPCLDTNQPTLVVKPLKQTVINPSPAYINYPNKYSETQTPVQIIHAQPQQPQTIQVAPISHSIQTAQPVPQLPPQQAFQPAAQPVIFVPPYNVPPPQISSPQPTPIVNILTPPAAPCNVMPPSTIEHKQEFVKEVDYIKPVFKPEPRPISRPEPEFQPKPVSMEVVSIESAPCKQDVLVLPSKPVAVYPEKQLAVEVTELEPQPVSGAQCICQKGRPHTLYRHHPKIHEHHLMVHPTQSIATSPLVVQPPYPLSYLSNNRPIVFGERYPTNTYGDTYQEHPYYPNTHSTWYPSQYPEYTSYPVKTYDPQYVSPSVTVNAFPYNNFRQAQSSSPKLTENNELEKEHPVARQNIDVPTSGMSKRKADPIQLEKNEQANVAQEQTVKSSNTPEMKFDEQYSMI